MEKTHFLIVDFWEILLLDNPDYKKNAMEVYDDIHKQIPVREENFKSWLHLFNKAAGECFE